MTSPNDFNQKIIQEFRANAGKVGAPFAGRSMLLLTSTGAKSAERRTTPLVYLADGSDWLVFASMGGAPRNPGWYHNLVAHPDASIEVGVETIPVRASVVTGDERDRLYAKQVSVVPAFGEYEAKTSRRIPVVRLERRHP